MKFNKESKIVRVSAFARGYYSGATAYGELYIPYDLYLKNKEELADLEVYANELDGKHSEISCDIEFEEMTFYEYLNSDPIDYSEYNDSLDERIYYRICDILEVSDKQGETLSDFSCEIEGLEKINNVETMLDDEAMSNLTDREKFLFAFGILLTFLEERLGE